MLKKTITYTDYNGVERKEDFWFNLSKAELMKMELSVAGGMAEMLTKLIDKQDGPVIMNTFEDIILKAYGEKSDDGRQFVKSPEISKAFSQTEAYSKLFMELITDSTAAAAFVNGIMPAEARESNKQIGEA